ncbi:unnamed protein product [Aphanomyces euteiches]
MKGQPVRPLAVALVVVVLVTDILYAGLIFGWAPMLLLLQEEDQYGELCLIPDERCADQDSRLNMIYTIASVAVNISSLPVGCILDYFGPKYSIILAAMLEISGLFLMGAADSMTFDVFLPAYTLCAVGGCITMMASYPSSFLIMSHQTAILAAISCLFDSSSVMLLAMYGAHASFGFTRQDLFFGFGFISIGVYALLVVLWHFNENFLPDQVDSTASTDMTFNSPLLQPRARRNSMRESVEQYGSLSEEALLDHRDTTAVVELYKTGQADNELATFSLGKQVRTFEFAFLLVYSSIHVLRANLYIGTNNKLLENYGDASRDYLYTKIFSFILPLGFLFVPFIDFFVEKKGLAVSLHIATGLGVLFNVLAMVPILSLQSVVFILFTGFRAFLYAAISAFAAKIFGLANLGKIVGLTFSCGSIVSLLQIPAVVYSNAVGSLDLVYTISILLCLALVPLTEWYRRRAERRIRHHSKVWKALGESSSSMKGLQYRHKGRRLEWQWRCAATASIWDDDFGSVAFV